MQPEASCKRVAASLLTTCNRLVIIKPEQAMRTHPDIGLVIADLLQLARFWLCIQLIQKRLSFKNLASERTIYLSKQADLYTVSVYDMSWNSCNVKFLSFRL